MRKIAYAVSLAVLLTFAAAPSESWARGGGWGGGSSWGHAGWGHGGGWGRGGWGWGRGGWGWGRGGWGWNRGWGWGWGPGWGWWGPGIALSGWGWGWGPGWGWGWGGPGWGWGGVAAPPVVLDQPSEWVQRGPEATADAEPAPASPTQGYWYYCPSSRRYYPNVKSCPEQWVPVPPRSQ